MRIYRRLLINRGFRQQILQISERFLKIPKDVTSVTGTLKIGDSGV
jgi:hypothetical protein